jgi:hypothetical protein
MIDYKANSDYNVFGRYGFAGGGAEHEECKQPKREYRRE